MTDLNHIALFVRVAEERSFSRAARLLALPKATVSRNIARLEADLGVRLLHRTTRKLELTAQGRSFYEQVTQGVAGLEAACELTIAAQTEPTGLLRVTAPVDFGAHHLMRWIPEFLSKFDKVNVELMLTDSAVDLLSERIDVGLRTGVLQNSSLIARKLAPTRRIVVASPSYLERRGAPRRIQDLERHDCVLFGHSLENVVWRLGGPDGEQEVRVTGRLAVDGVQAAMRAAIEGLGIALLPSSLAADDVRAGRLKQVLPRYSVEGGLYAVFPSNRHMSAALRAFLDFATHRARQLPK